VPRRGKAREIQSTRRIEGTNVVTEHTANFRRAERARRHSALLANHSKQDVVLLTVTDISAQKGVEEQLPRIEFASSKAAR